MDRVTTRNPWRQLVKIRQEINELLEQFLANLSLPQGMASTDFVPETDVVETAEVIRVYVMLPGAVEEDIDLHLERDALVVSGTRQPPFDERNTHATLRESRYGVFYRYIPLPAPVDTNAVRAQFADGMLMVFLPKQKALGP